jgi:hypothetical protein
MTRTTAYAAAALVLILHRIGGEALRRPSIAG